MLPFNSVTTQTKVCPSGESDDRGASHSMNFLHPPASLSYQSRCDPNGVPTPPRNESPTENEPPIY